MTPTKFSNQITPVILTCDEAPNIGRVLAKLNWAREVVVVDSGSRDDTLNILASYSNVRVFTREFDCHSNQWNFAISHTGIETEWVLALDADYVLSDELIGEIASLEPELSFAGYMTEFRYCVFGKPLRSTLYPSAVTLFRRSQGQFEQEGHTQRLRLKGVTGRLMGPIFHDDRKPLARWISSQERYAELECRHLLSKPISELCLQDRMRRLIVVTTWLVPLYCLTVKRGLLDGWAGIYYALQRGVAEAILALKLVEATWVGRPRV